MKMKQILAVIALSATSFIASAATGNSISVYATQGSLGSISTDTGSGHTKRFDILLANTGDKAVDLNKICLNAYAPDGKKFELDTVDETLVSGSLKPNVPVKGFAVFSSQDDSVYKSTLVKASTDCK
jgi:Domain of unknown function (DUF4354)